MRCDCGSDGRIVAEELEEVRRRELQPWSSLTSRALTAVPDSCTSMARAHCFHITAMTFEAQYFNKNTCAEKEQNFIRIAIAISVGLSA